LCGRHFSLYDGCRHVEGRQRQARPGSFRCPFDATTGDLLYE
jgi:hypothetical protein